MSLGTAWWAVSCTSFWMLVSCSYYASPWMTEWMGSLQLRSGLFGLCWWLLEMRYNRDRNGASKHQGHYCSCWACPHCESFARQSRDWDGSVTLLPKASKPGALPFRSLWVVLPFSPGPISWPDPFFFLPGSFSYHRSSSTAPSPGTMELWRFL